MDTDDLAVLQLLQCVVYRLEKRFESLRGVETLHNLLVCVLDFVSILEQLVDLGLNCSSILKIFPIVLGKSD